MSPQNSCYRFSAQEGYTHKCPCGASTLPLQWRKQVMGENPILPTIDAASKFHVSLPQRHSGAFTCPGHTTWHCVTTHDIIMCPPGFPTWEAKEAQEFCCCGPGEFTWATAAGPFAGVPTQEAKGAYGVLLLELGQFRLGKQLACAHLLAVSMAGTISCSRELCLCLLPPYSAFMPGNPCPKKRH